MASCQMWASVRVKLQVVAGQGVCRGARTRPLTYAKKGA